MVAICWVVALGCACANTSCKRLCGWPVIVFREMFFIGDNMVNIHAPNLANIIMDFSRWAGCPANSKSTTGKNIMSSYRTSMEISRENCFRFSCGILTVESLTELICLSLYRARSIFSQPCKCMNLAVSSSPNSLIITSAIAALIFYISVLLVA